MTVSVMHFPEGATMSEVEYRIDAYIADPLVGDLQVDDRTTTPDFYTVFEVQLDGTCQAVSDFTHRHHAQALVDRLNSSTIRSGIFAA